MKTRRRTHRRRIIAAVLAAAGRARRRRARRSARRRGGCAVPPARPGDDDVDPVRLRAEDRRHAGRVRPAGRPGARRLGDTKFDSPGASRAPQYDLPRTIQVVRPERTIVRDTDPVLPIALSGAALLVALGLAGTALIRVRSLRLG